MIYNSIIYNNGVGLQPQIVETLTAVPIPNPQTLYLVPKNQTEKNIYEEYLWIEGKWELIGTTELTLPKPLYQHNIHMHYRPWDCTNSSLNGKYVFEVTFMLINDDAQSYSFIHNWRQLTTDKGAMLSIEGTASQDQVDRLRDALLACLSNNEIWINTNGDGLDLTKYYNTAPSKKADEIVVIPASGVAIAVIDNVRRYCIISGIGLTKANDKVSQMFTIQSTPIDSTTLGLGDYKAAVKVGPNEYAYDELKVVDTVVCLTHN